MDRFEGRCWLDWQANLSTNLGGIEASVVITPAEAGWDAHGQLIHDDEREALAFLCNMDPVFTLRFHDGGTVQVTLTLIDDRRFTLTEYTGSASRQADFRTDLYTTGPASEYPPRPLVRGSLSFAESALGDGSSPVPLLRPLTD